MPVEIIVEDGSGVEDANSYATVETAREFAEKRGVVLSADNDEVSSQLIRAFDWLDAKEEEFQGVRVYADTAFPRAGVTVNGFELAADAIPKQLIAAQLQLVIAQSNGIDISPNFVPADYVVKEKVGPLETTFADPVEVGVSPKLGAVDAVLSPLFLRRTVAGLVTVRV